MLSQQLIKELGDIIEEDYRIQLSPQELFSIANSLAGYYDLLSKYDYEDKNK